MNSAMNKDCIYYDECDIKGLSVCCGAKIYDDLDICSDCREYTSAFCEDCPDYINEEILKDCEDRAKY